MDEEQWSVERTAEDCIPRKFNRPLHGLGLVRNLIPSDEWLGYLSGVCGTDSKLMGGI